MQSNVPPFTDPEKAREAGLKSAEARKTKAERSLEDPLGSIQTQLAPRLGGFVEELQKAAKGEGEWAKLPPASRLQALSKLLEYAVGRPRSAEKPTPGPAEKPDSPDAAGISIE